MKNISPYNRLINASTFTALDFETANEDYNSACSVSYIRVVNGEIADQGYTLIKPKNTRISEAHRLSLGLTAKELEAAPEFDQVWETLEPLIAGQVVVPLNCAFDIEVLIAMANDFGISLPDFRYICSPKVVEEGLLDLKNFKLREVSPYFDLEFDFHNSLSEETVYALMKANALTSPVDYKFKYSYPQLSRLLHRKRLQE